MDKEKIIMFLWGCVTVVFVSLFVMSSLVESVKVYKLSNGTTISLGGSLAEIILIICVYYITKLLINKDNH